MKIDPANGRPTPRPRPQAPSPQRALRSPAGRSEFSTGRGSALKARALAVTGATLRDAALQERRVYARAGARLRDAAGHVLRPAAPNEPLAVVGEADEATARALDAAAGAPHHWLEVQSAGQTAFIAEDVTTPAPTAAGALSRRQGGRAPTPPGNFVNGNYTDLGYDALHQYAPQNVAADLDRLRAAGVTNVRIWADPPYVDQVDDEARARRVHDILTLAAARNMTVTVDLFDVRGHADEGPAGDAAMRARIQAVIGANRDAPNVIWSLTNEPQIGPGLGSDAAQLEAFTDWYLGLVSDMRRAGAATISAEVVPTCVGNDPTFPPTQRAMQRIASAVDVISPHLYFGQSVDDAQGSDQYQSFLAWRALAQQLHKPLWVGEFGLDAPVRDFEHLDAWLRHLQGLGVQTTLLWQLLKDEPGHTDDRSYDITPGGDAAFVAALPHWLGTERSP